MDSITKNTSQHLTDEEVIKAVLAGEKRLYEVIMRKYNQRLYRIVMSVINDANEEEDIMQVAYIKAYEHLADFKFESAFSTWLTRIAINESLRCLRSKKQVAKLDSIENVKQANELTPIQNVMNKELQNLLENALVQLPEKYRLVFVMREVEDMSTMETMECLNLSESNVKVRLNRAKEMLRDSLSGYYKSNELYGFHLTRCNMIVKNVLANIEK